MSVIRICHMLLLFVLLILPRTTPAGAGDGVPGVTLHAEGVWRIDFVPELPLTRKDFSFAQWQPSLFGGDESRLEYRLPEGKTTEADPLRPEGYVLLDMRRLTGTEGLTDLRLQTYAHGFGKSEVARLCRVAYSVDGVSYQEVALVAEQGRALADGWGQFWLRALQPVAGFRYLRLQLSPELAVSLRWKIKFGEIMVSRTGFPPLAEAVLKQNKESGQGGPTAGNAGVAPSVQTETVVPQTPVMSLPPEGIRTTIAQPEVLIAELPEGRKEWAHAEEKSLRWRKITLSDRVQKSRNWNDQGVSAAAHTVLYRFGIRTDSLPVDRIMLCLKQSAFLTVLSVDGNEIATFREGYLPLEADITDAIRAPSTHLVQLEVRDHFSVRDRKDAPVIPLGAMFRYTKGLQYPPVLQRRSRYTIEDPFVRSSADLSSVEVSAFIQGQTPADKADLSVRLSVAAEGATAGFQKELPVPVTGLIRCEVPAAGLLRRWEPDDPQMYSVRLQLLDKGGTVDERVIQTGHRSVVLQGENLLLNGRKIRLLGPWAHVGEWSFARGASGSLPIGEVYRLLKSRGMNYGRLHAQVYPEEFYEEADRVGFLLVAESALNHAPVAESSIVHVQNMVRMLRNHPSIILWSGSNEFEHWKVPRPAATEEFLVRVQEQIHRLDPTRPVQHSGFGDALGKLDLYNIHYPESGAAEFPRSFYWKNQPERIANLLYADNYGQYNPTGKKPTAIGEQLIPGSSYHLESVFGERALNLYRQPSKESLAENSRLLAAYWREAIRAYREQNVLMVSPNVFYLNDGLDSIFLQGIAQEGGGVGAYLAERLPEMHAGKNARTLRLFEEQGTGFTGAVRLVLQLGTYKQEQTVAVVLAASTMQDQPVSFVLPALESDAEGELTVVLQDDKGVERYRAVQPVKYYARRAVVPGGRPVYLLGQAAEQEAMLRAGGVSLTPVGIEQLASLPVASSLIVPGTIGKDLLQRQGKVIEQLVAGGGQVLLLAREDLPEIFPVALKLRSGKYAGATCGFIRAPSHPLFAGGAVTDADLRYWGDDLRICKQALYKPAGGPIRALIDCGEDLSLTALAEIRHGRGRYLLSQLLDHGQGIAANRVLCALATLLQTPMSEVQRTGRIAEGADSFSAAILQKMGWQTGGAGTPENRQVLFLDQTALTRLSPDEAARAIQNAETVYLHGISAEQLLSLLPQVGVPLTLRPGEQSAAGGKSGSGTKKTVKQGPVIVERDPLLDGVSSADLNWFSDGVAAPTTVVPSDGWRAPVAPGGWAVWRGEGRTVIVDSLPWNQEVDFPENRDRFLSVLSANLQIAVPGQSSAAGGAGRYQPLNLLPVCNAAAADYIGPTFPTGEVVLEGVPFRLLASSAAAPHSFLRLNGRSQSSQNTNSDTLVYDTPIDRFTVQTREPVVIALRGKQAQAVFFAHAATRNWRAPDSNAPVCLYRFVYEDETSELIPIKLGREILDSRNRPRETGSCALGLTCANERNGDGETFTLGVYRWDNPHPERKLLRLEILPGVNPQSDPMIFAVTLREASETFF